MSKRKIGLIVINIAYGALCYSLGVLMSHTDSRLFSTTSFRGEVTMNNTDMWLAVYHEHRERTGHDPKSASRDPKALSAMMAGGLRHKCVVCGYLAAVARELKPGGYVPPEPILPVPAYGIHPGLNSHPLNN